MTPAFALTSYYAQGTTIKKFIIDLKPSKKNDFACIYVILSRARTLNDFLILRTFPIEVLKSLIPNDPKLELIRLRDLESLLWRIFSKKKVFKTSVLIPIYVTSILLKGYALILHLSISEKYSF